MKYLEVIQEADEDDVIVFVHPLQAGEKVKIRLRTLHDTFGSERVYYAQGGDLNRRSPFHTYCPPSKPRGKYLPPPENVGRIYVAGAFRSASVAMQNRWLKDAGYDTELVVDAIEG